jgi:hypothetical protein
MPPNNPKGRVAAEQMRASTAFTTALARCAETMRGARTTAAVHYCTRSSIRVSASIVNGRNQSHSLVHDCWRLMLHHGPPDRCSHLCFRVSRTTIAPRRSPTLTRSACRITQKLLVGSLLSYDAFRAAKYLDRDVATHIRLGADCYRRYLVCWPCEESTTALCSFKVDEAFQVAASIFMLITAFRTLER